MDDPDYDQPTRKKPTQITPVVSDKTRAIYLKVIQRRKWHIMEKLGLDDMKVTADMVVDDYIERAPLLKKNTLRYNRAAIREWIIGNRWLSEKDARRLLSKLDDTKGQLQGRVGKPEQREIKGIAFDDWQTIQKQIEQTEPGGFEYIAGQVLLASIHTGMRPIEWQTAKFTGETYEALLDMEYQWPRLLRGDFKPRQVLPVMFIQNAKHTNGRGGDGIRYVPVPPEAFEPIRRVLAHIREYQTNPGMHRNGKFESWLRLVRDGCAKIMKKAFPRRKSHYTVYNCRHQFSAELKSCMSREVVAELMGHTSEETAGEHYARKKSAWKLSPMFREGEPGPPAFVPRNSQGDHCMPTSP